MTTERSEQKLTGTPVYFIFLTLVRNFLQQKLSSAGIRCETRQLELGDFLWVGISNTHEEVVLDYIVERKIVTDLCSSIQDGRYKGNNPAHLPIMSP